MSLTGFLIAAIVIAIVFAYGYFAPEHVKPWKPHKGRA